MFGFTAEALSERDGSGRIVAVLAPQIGTPTGCSRCRGRCGRTGPRIFDIVRFKDGRVFERFVSPHRVGGRVVGFVSSFRDIGQSMRTAEALEHHRAFLETAQEVAHIGSWVAELDGSDRLGWSAETHRIFGVPPGLFPGTSEAFFGFVHPDDRETVRAASQATEGTRSRSVEHRIVRSDGTVRWVHELSASIAFATRTAARRWIGTVQTDQGGSFRIAAPVAEDGGDRPAGRRHRARSQQRAHGHCAGAEPRSPKCRPGTPRADIEAEIPHGNGARRRGHAPLLAFSRKQVPEPRARSI